jgi:lipoprotein-anchoring transpeptidase ErfK/SrfK
MAEDSRMMGVGGHGASGTAGRLWRIAALTAAGAIGAGSHAEAALHYWSDFDPGYYRPGPPVSQRRPKVRRQAKKIAAPEKESSKPQGPLILAISIEKQKLRIYDANGFFAETPISTGMKGHPTPMGVFSIIQKHKFHHSNIYSGAPMPYMQRITWSGVAMHAGVLPGYPASHGCIRMPMAFAMKMWNWTKMGARVVVTPGEMTPASFSHPMLVAQKVGPSAANEPPADAPPAPKSDKASEADTPNKPATSEANLELRPTVGHSDGARPVIAEPSASTALRDQTHTADAGAAVTMTDAASSAANTSPRDEASFTEATSNTVEEKSEAAKPDVATSEAEPATAPRGEVASSDDKPAKAKPSENATAEIKAAEVKSAATGATGGDVKKPDPAEAAAQSSGDAAKPEASATGSLKAEAKGDEKADEKKVEAKTDDVTAEASKPDAPKPAEKPDPGIKAVTDAAPAKKEQARLPDAEKPAAASKPEPATQAAPKRSGQIAVFVSRKDSKLYVRQNFSPLFNVPVTIAPSDRPLGTHVFTARIDKDDANVVRWSVVSLPVPVRYAERRDDDERASRRRKITGAVEMKPIPMPDSPAEALDRLTIPADAMARITDGLSTGGSIIVSDQGINAGETGEGTDFIVSLR